MMRAYTEYEPWADCKSYPQVASAPPGTEAATLDIEAAYRTIPVWPPHKCFLVVTVGDDHFIDHVFPFGLTTAGGVQGNVADATVDILHNLNLGPIKKWVDDHTFFRFAIGGGDTLPDGSVSPFRYAHGLEDVYKHSRPLGVPWHPLKWCNFAIIFTYLGFLWNLVNHTVELPDSKREKYIKKLSSVVSHIEGGGRLSCKDAMSINGTLSHVSFVIPHGRAYLANLSSFIAQFNAYPKSHARFVARHPPSSVKNDLRWWLNTLSQEHPPRCLKPRGTTQDVDLWVDASTEWGIGIVLGNSWNAWTLHEGWKGNGRDIGWLEAIAVELAVRTLFDRGWKDAAVLIHSDNQGVIGSFQRGRSRNFQVNVCIRRVEAIAMASNVFHVLSYVESARNRADTISRGEVGSPDNRLAPIQLPEELTPFIASYVQ